MNSDRPTYAHDAHCNTVHEAGPQPCPPARSDDLDWPARLRAMMAARAARKLAARARRNAFATARSFGLSRRQASKLARETEPDRAARRESGAA